MIQVRNLAKTYPNGTQALHDFTLNLTTGIVGLVGPNGAGKTTVMRILATLLEPTSGEVQIASHTLRTASDRAAIRKLIGYLPQGNGFHLELTAEENLDYFALLKHINDRQERSRRIDYVLEATGLQQVRRSRTQTLSGGMKRRLGIAITLLGHPRVLILDEPTAGLDPEERYRFRALMAESASNRLILLSSHIVEDIEQIAHDLIVIHHGQLLYHGTLAALRETMGVASLEAAYLRLISDGMTRP